MIAAAGFLAQEAVTGVTWGAEDNVMSKCGWSPFQGHTFKSRVHETWVNGTQVWDGQRISTTHGHHVGERLTFAR